ncbi:helix-turn-helix domain-containing protein [Sporosarcina sp. FSL K6-1508]|uniref:helix-turn-helix domain-containing protein n=1 Tax=Sporosarcina sp. FSL K6-1508 TaxID=2921553 RepID=UPI0030FB456D
MSLGKRLKNEREKRKWSQKYVAERVGITNTVLSNYERDYRDPDTDMLAKLAELYEVATDYLLGVRSKKDETRTNGLTDKDEKDIAKRMDKMKADLIEANEDVEGLNYMGEPMSEEAFESFMEALEHAERIVTIANKKYAPNKYKNKDEK